MELTEMPMIWKKMTFTQYYLLDKLNFLFHTSLFFRYPYWNRRQIISVFSFTFLHKKNTAYGLVYYTLSAYKSAINVSWLSIKK